MAEKTQKEIDAQVKALKEIRPKVKPYNFFGDSNLDKLDAQVKVLEEDMISEEVFDEWPEEEGDMNIRMAADDAIAWRDGESDEEDLATDWPLEKK